MKMTNSVASPQRASSFFVTGVFVGDFVDENMVQYGMFEEQSKRDKLRKTVYALKDKFGLGKLRRAAELSDEEFVKDVIGFGSVKDLHAD